MNKPCAGFRAGSLVLAVWVGLVPQAAAQADETRPFRAKVNTKLSDLPGSWKITYTNEVVRVYTFDKAGRMSGSAGDQRLAGQIEQRDGRLLLTFNEEDKLERLTLRVDNQLDVEQWSPQAGFPEKKADIVGFGPRVPYWQTRPYWECVEDVKISDLAGQWTVIYFNTAIHNYVFDKAGKMSGRDTNAQGNDAPLAGQVMLSEGRLFLNHHGLVPGQIPPLERLALRLDGRLIIEHWNPRAGFYSGNKPDTVGIGVPVSGKNAPGVGLLDNFMLKKMEAIGCAAASLTVTRGNRTYYSLGYGWLDEDHKARMQPDTPMGIASCDKPFEIAAIRQLAREGRLDLNASVFKVLGVKPAGPIVDPRIWKITPNVLLEHKAGWQGEPLAKADHAYQATGGKPAPPTPLAEWLDKELPFVMTQQLAWAPGAKAEYDNFGFHVLKRIIMRLSHRSLPDYYRSQLCRPFGVAELKWIRQAGPPRPGEPHRLWNGLHGDPNDSASLGVSTPAMCAFMNCFWMDGRPRSANPQEWVAYGSYNNATSLMHWRSDGINIAYDFNGRSDQDHVELNDLEAAVSQLVADKKIPSR